MKTGICIKLKNVDDISKKFALTHEYGFDNCQLISWDPCLWTEENAHLIKKYAYESDIDISAFWCGWEGPEVWNFYEGQQTIGLVPEEYREIRIKNLCDGSIFAKKIGVNDIVTHMGFIPENPFDPKFPGFCASVRKVANYLKSNNQRLLFESGQETPVTMLRCFEEVGEDNLGINFDTGNLVLYGKANPADALDVYGKYVCNVHIKDGFYPTNGRELGKYAKIGEGRVDFKRVIAKLYELGYNGPLTIEMKMNDKPKVNDEIVKAKEYIENILKDYNSSKL